ncbi:MarR family winged helix-turn-helix transcriptional regulator [Sinomonas sp.]|uniref:MarR family winged helix-turn-helix transcriptional regulator n=1 Tax=Sinomonas sp. TaxID=1914986 RepID=UPI003F7DA2D4
MNAQPDRPGYWYAQDTPAKERAVQVLNALRDYRASEGAMRRRTRATMSMGETDLLALRYLLEAQAQGRDLSPKDLAAKLGITSASMTTLVDRLVRSGHVSREPHPTDRRALILRPTQGSDHEVRKTLGEMHRRMVEVAAALSPKESETVVGFLRDMAAAVDKIEPLAH